VGKEVSWQNWELKLWLSIVSLTHTMGETHRPPTSTHPPASANPPLPKGNGRANFLSGLCSFASQAPWNAQMWISAQPDGHRLAVPLRDEIRSRWYGSFPIARQRARPTPDMAWPAVRRMCKGSPCRRFSSLSGARILLSVRSSRPRMRLGVSSH